MSSDAQLNAKSRERTKINRSQIRNRASKLQTERKNRKRDALHQGYWLYKQASAAG